MTNYSNLGFNHITNLIYNMGCIHVPVFTPLDALDFTCTFVGVCESS